jgi:hypothetical protein
MRNDRIIWIKGEKVHVNEEIFRAYMQSVWLPRITRKLL